MASNAGDFKLQQEKVAMLYDEEAGLGEDSEEYVSSTSPENNWLSFLPKVYNFA